MLTPTNEAELAEAVKAAAADKRPLRIQGGGTRSALGRPVQAAETLSVAGLSGVSLYEPAALTLIAAAGTPVSEIEAQLADGNQRLPFEPMDHRALMGSEGEPTIGGVVSCGVSGSRRLHAGGCRDALIGVRYVDGDGTVVKNGGRVMKNVTGYDLVKLLCGSYGTLGVLSEVAFKLEPKPEAELTLAVDGLDEATAVEAMAAAMATPYAVTGAAHRTAAVADGDASETLLRIEGMAGQAAYRADQLEAAIGRFGTVRRVEGDAHAALWKAVRDVAVFAGRPGPAWRLSLKPSDAPAAVAAVREVHRAAALYDWAGGLVWLNLPETVEDGDAGAAAVRDAVARHGGHATLIRASDATRAAVDVFEPEVPALATLSTSLRARFDPAGIFNPGLMRG